MTEEEWLEATEFEPMLEFLKGKANDRKLRLFACGSCRAIWTSLTYRRSQQSIEVAEQFADGLADEKSLIRAESIATEAVRRYFANEFGRRMGIRAGTSLTERRFQLAVNAAHVHKPFLIGRLRSIRNDPDLSVLAPFLLRDIFGNPFRPVVADPAWLTPTVVAIATSLYQDRAFDRLPILADALEEAGCTDAASCSTVGNRGTMSGVAGPSIWYWGRNRIVTPFEPSALVRLGRESDCEDDAMNDSNSGENVGRREKSKLLTKIVLAFGGLLAMGGLVAAAAIYHIPPAFFGYSEEDIRSSHEKYCQHRSNYKRLLKSIPTKGDHDVIEARHKERDAEFYSAQALEKKYGEDWAARGLALVP